MVKTIILEERTSKTINLSEISEKFCGIIICYNTNIPVGYIVLDDPDWTFYNSISIQGFVHYNNDDLSLLIKDLQSEGINKFEAIVFND